MDKISIIVPCYNEQEVLPITAPMFLEKIKSLAAAGQITEDSRVMFVKRYWYTESVAQIAETFGMKENSVSVKLMRLRKKLRKKLEKEGVVL